jgi:ribonucleoside-triphosphate reductase
MIWTPSQQFVYYRTFSRWRDDLGRRETFEESVERYFSFMEQRFRGIVPDAVFARCRRAFLSLDVVGSMRAFWAAGPALERENICAYNCWSMAIRDFRAFAELFYILMCGSGCSFSVEREYIRELPSVKPQSGERRGVHVVDDSREGWANALLDGLHAWSDGADINFDVSRVRPKGARLKTMGGRASGPQPLVDLLGEARTLLLGAQNRRLTDLECTDLGNHVGETVEVGGIRRAAESVFTDVDSDAMRHAKDHPFPRHRQQSNNSAVYFGRPTRREFELEWEALRAGGTGERGIWNVEAAGNACARRAIAKLGMTWEEYRRHLRSNPCFEIILMALLGQACNLSEIVVRPWDTVWTLTEKVECAVWLGAMQAHLTEFGYIRQSFRETCEEERLLGVSLTGQMDNPDVLDAANLRVLHRVAVTTARAASEAFGTKMSAAITAGKPSGDTSQVVGCAPGMHARWGKHQIRRYLISASDPLFRMLRDQGVPCEPKAGQDADSADTWVLSFPQKAPDGALVRGDVNALSQLEWYLKMRRDWCEHNQSVTVYVREDEWDPLREWVWEHFDEVCGVAFLPYDGGKYVQAPNEEVSCEEYEKLAASFPRIDYSRLSEYENEDQTTGARALACSGDRCSI